MRPSGKPVLALAAVLLCGCHGSPEATPTAQTGQPSKASPSSESKGAVTKLKIEDVKVGTGVAAAQGDQLAMLYTGKLGNGTVFDSNDKPGGKPFRFMLGAGSVIKGWDQGLIGMKVGGERRLSIPSELAYGSASQGSIPANSDLFFDVKLKSVRKRGDEGTVLLNDKKKGSGPGVKKGDKVIINYSTSLDDGTLVDEKYVKTPLNFKVGSGEVKDAIDQGILGMKAGGERTLTLDSQMLQAGPQMQPGQVAVVDIKLLTIES